MIARHKTTRTKSVVEVDLLLCNLNLANTTNPPFKIHIHFFLTNTKGNINGTQTQKPKTKNIHKAKGDQITASTFFLGLINPFDNEVQQAQTKKPKSCEDRFNMWLAGQLVKIEGRVANEAEQSRC
ncbi:hypothetical protein GBA52_028992 [Prunus armeniaca]|nr:hypothetical protein GBA52_028992 [Prunus armeniaca]